MTVPPASDRPGLFAERTQLAWERTAIGFLAVGALVLLPHRGPLTADRAVVAAASVLVAFIVFGSGAVGAGRSTRSPIRRCGWSAWLPPCWQSSWWC